MLTMFPIVTFQSNKNPDINSRAVIHSRPKQNNAHPVLDLNKCNEMGFCLQRATESIHPQCLLSALIKLQSTDDLSCITTNQITVCEDIKRSKYTWWYEDNTPYIHI